ncbi:hypothetical protein [Streptomyces sp. HUAS ZL42]|uniref:hypothetical protein n=1 Tax=Streptomyces sp. HUAS ZL42 TaxID=3231715 RepID=UPI00345EAE2E
MRLVDGRPHATAVDAQGHGNGEHHSAVAHMTDDGRFVLVGVGEYQDANWPRLSHVPASVGRLYELFRSLGYGHELPELTAGGDWASITQRLRAWHGGGSRLVLYWTGHGCVDAGEHFLIAADSPGTRLDEYRAITAKALARFLAHREFHEVLVLLDCCASGVAASRVAAEICEVLDHSSAAGPERRFAVIASTRGFESAEDGVFAETLERVVRQGPEDRRWTEHDETIRSDELADVMDRVMARRDGGTAYVARGAPVPALRNPLHPSATVPDEDVETKRLRRLRATEVDQHLVLSARGIEVGETGWYFCGRDRLLRRLIGWLAQAERGLFAVTGSPGTGKSALLGRIATLSVPDLRAVAEAEGALNDTPNSALPPLGCVDLALSCRNKTLEDCLRAVADTLGLPARRDGWLRAAEVVRQVGELGRRVAVVIDGLDEAKAAEAVPIAADLLRPLADLPGVRVLVGTRPHRAGKTTVTNDAGPLIQALAPDETAVLDDEPGSRADLTAYARRRLLGSEHSSRPVGEGFAREWAERIAEASDGNFLYARIAGRAVLNAPPVPPGTDWRAELERLLSGDLSAVLDEEFARSPDPERLCDLLRPLAWAEGAGLPRRDLWPVLAGALSDSGRGYEDGDIAWVLEHAGFHLVESGESGQTVYRLYHQSLIDHFRGISPPDVHERITRALLTTVSGRGPAAWESAHPYLRRHLAAHARAAGLLPEVMDDLGFLTCADPARTAAAVRSLPDRFTLPVARLYLRAAHRLASLSPEERLRTLLMTAMFEEQGLLDWFAGHTAVPAFLSSASTAPDDFSVVLRGHSGPVVALQPVDTGEGRELLASAGGDTTVRLWDPDTGETRMVLTGPDTTVTALTRLTDVRGRRLLVAAAGRDLYVWDLGTGGRVTVLRGHSDTVLCLTVLDDEASPLLASAGEDRTLRLWRPDDWSATVLTGHVGPVTAVAAGRLPDGQRFLLSGGADCSVRRWDVTGPDTVRAAGVMHGHTGTVHVLACPDDTGTLAVSGAEDGTVRVWDVEDLMPRRVLAGTVRGGVRSLSPFRFQGGTRLAVAGSGSRMAVLDASAGAVLHALTSRMSALPEQLDSRGASGTHVIPADWQRVLSPTEQQRVTPGGSYALTALRTGRGEDLFASAGWDGAVRLWDSASGGPPGQPDYDSRWARRITAPWRPPKGDVPVALAVAGVRGGVWVADTSGEVRTMLWPAHRRVGHIAALVLPDGRPVLVLVEHESRVLHLLDAETGQEIRTGEAVAPLKSLNGPVTSLVVADAPGWMSALTVHYDTAPPSTLFWLRHNKVHTEDGLPTGRALTAVPCVRRRGKPLVATIGSDGVIEVRGEPGVGTRLVGRAAVPPVPGLTPVALRAARGQWQLAVAVQVHDDDRHYLELWDLKPGDGAASGRPLRHPGTPFTHLARLETPRQDLIVAACSDSTLRVWNPARPGREPLTVPLPGPVNDLSTAGPDRVYALIDEHWFALRLIGLGSLLSGRSG